MLDQSFYQKADEIIVGKITASVLSRQENDIIVTCQHPII